MEFLIDIYNNFSVYFKSMIDFIVSTELYGYIQEFYRKHTSLFFFVATIVIGLTMYFIGLLLSMLEVKYNFWSKYFPTFYNSRNYNNFNDDNLKNRSFNNGYSISYSYLPKNNYNNEIYNNELYNPSYSFLPQNIHHDD